MKKFKEEQIITIDLHHHTVDDAKQKLQLVMAIAPSEIREIVVIHGYRRGTALRDMVRQDFKNSRISRKYISLNLGITSLILQYN
jgi:DNA-nicking Smr family endonuclease